MSQKADRRATNPAAASTGVPGRSPAHRRPSQSSKRIAAGDEELLDRPALVSLQQRRLRALLDEVLPDNAFYRRRFEAAGVAADSIRSTDDLARLPFTTKDEILADQAAHPPYGTNLTYPLEKYVRVHQTSGTTGEPLRWLDTPASWQWFLDCWQTIYSAMGLQREDRLFFPFSFGPFIGFWGAFEGAAQLGNFCLPGGGMSSAARLRSLLDHAVTVVACTPTYALRLAEVAAQEGIDLAASPVRALIVAGEPGGSIAATRSQIEKAWGARVIDHTGMTEIGATGVECCEAPGGVHLLESQFIAEVVDPKTLEAVPDGELGELVLTNLGRLGSPLVRYRTGDLVRLSRGRCVCGRHWARMEGGILGRCDEMISIRGNNVYPGALEAIVRRFPEVAEYRVEIDRSGSLARVTIQLEPAANAGCDEKRLGARVGRAIRDTLLFRADVVTVPPGALPRFEMKARRFVLTN